MSEIYYGITSNNIDERAKMIALVIPPVADCFMPLLGIPQISGYLKKQGISCKVYDISIDLLEKLTSDSFIKSHINKMKCSEPKYGMHNFPEFLERYLVKDDTKYTNAIVRLNLISCYNHKYRISTDNFISNYSWWEEDKVKKEINEQSLLNYAYNELPSVQEILNLNYKYIGISISYESQVIPALIFAQLIKQNKKDITIIFGGSFFYTYEAYFYKLFFTLDIVDILVIGPGEKVLEQLIKSSISSLNRIKGVEVKRALNKYIINSKATSNVTTNYSPDFSNINFQKYLSQEPAFPYMIKDRCYYGRCNFCNGDRNKKYGYSKNIRDAYSEISEIYNKTGVNNVYIVDAALSPEDLRFIANNNIGTNLKWIANVRFDHKWADKEIIKGLSKSGCKMLRFGFETASQTILDLMNKGTNIDTIEKILTLTSQVGILNHLYIMFGYPGESQHDRNLTMDFLSRIKRLITSYSLSFFQPIPNTKIYEQIKHEMVALGINESNMNNFVYRSEDNYREICKDVARLNKVLRGFALTNSAYYSANIFSEIKQFELENNNNDVIINANMFYFAKESIEYYDKTPEFETNIKITQKYQYGDIVECVVFDFYKYSKIYISVQKDIANILKKDFIGEISSLLYNLDNNTKKAALELLDIISEYSSGVILLKRLETRTTNFDIMMDKTNDFSNMAIQFMPNEPVIID